MLLKSFPTEYQMDRMDCGPTSLKIVSKFYGRFYSLQFLREKCGSTKEGVSLADLCIGAENIGLKTRVIKCSTASLETKIPLPCILHWNNNHFVVLYSIKKDKFHISDPENGLTSYSKKEFSNKWLKKGTKKGVALILEPSAEFLDLNPSENSKIKNNHFFFLNYLKPYKKNFNSLILVMLIITLTQASLPFISRAIIDVGIHTGDLSFIDMVIIANIIILLTATLSHAVKNWIILHITSRVNIALLSDYLIKLMRLPVSFFENKMIGDVLQRANDHERIRNFIMGHALELVFSLLTFLSFSAILLIYNLVIFSVFTIGTLVYFCWVFAFLRYRKKLDLNYFNLTASSQSYWVETITNMQDIKVNNYERAKRWKWENIQAKLYKVNLKLSSVTNSQNLGAQFIDSLKNILITFFCARAVIEGTMTFGVMISTQVIIGLLNGPVQQFVQFIISAQMAKISVLRLNEIHTLEDEENTQSNKSLILPEDKSLILKNVSFQYAPNNKFVLQNLKLIIPQGKITAIVGDSGSGKSTLLKLLLRLYKPTYGEVNIGNMNINNIDLTHWRDKCGVVLQDGKIFNDTVLNNIILDDENIDYDLLRKAVETANIANEIESLPLGYKTKMGEQGRGLSGGQKQRILIARALYKDPDYLFFDEATNALDTINERKIVEALDEVFSDKTVVVVAHRLSTIRKASQIIVMQDGRVTEAGDHYSLMQREGHYFNLIQTQTNLS